VRPTYPVAIVIRCNSGKALKFGIELLVEEHFFDVVGVGWRKSGHRHRRRPLNPLTHRCLIKPVALSKYDSFEKRIKRRVNDAKIAQAYLKRLVLTTHAAIVGSAACARALVRYARGKDKRRFIRAKTRHLAQAL
jgi:hypothetical protein